jgi:hypothetical protein
MSINMICPKHKQLFKDLQASQRIWKRERGAIDRSSGPGKNPRSAFVNEKISLSKMHLLNISQNHVCVVCPDCDTLKSATRKDRAAYISKCLHSSMEEQPICIR